VKRLLTDVIVVHYKKQRKAILENQQLIIGAISLLCFIPAIMIHEVAHGWVAHRLGDPTAKAAGRISLNPLKHIDPFGTVILPILLALSGSGVFGYAKPVPYNPNYFKNIKVGEVLTGLAGPASNLVMAFIGAIAAFVIKTVFPSTSSEAIFWVYNGCYLFVLINLYLMFFNLLPIPPLDGSSIIVPFLPKKALPTWYKIQQYSMPILIVIVLVLPYFLPFSPLGVYLGVTAGNLTELLFSF
jgi:Zn-dependent protease